MKKYDDSGARYMTMGRPIAMGLLIAVSSYLTPVALSAEPATGIDPAALYHDYCSVCHGDKGDGNSHARQGLNPPPKDFTDAATAAAMSRELMIAVVTHGKPGTAMTAWNSRLNDEEIALIVDFIRENFMPTGSQSGEQESNSEGAEIYQGSCSVCHGDDGKGAHWAGSGLKPPPRDFTSELSRTTLDRERMRSAILEGRPGTAMTAFSTQLSPAQADAVIDYIQQAFMGMDAPQ